MVPAEVPVVAPVWGFVVVPVVPIIPGVTLVCGFVVVPLEPVVAPVVPVIEPLVPLVPAVVPALPVVVIEPLALVVPVDPTVPVEPALAPLAPVGPAVVLGVVTDVIPPALQGTVELPAVLFCPAAVEPMPFWFELPEVALGLVLVHCPIVLPGVVLAVPTLVPA